MNVIESLKGTMKAYELSSRSFNEDAINYTKKAEKAALLAEEYNKAIQLLEKSNNEI